jgi:hypothetical protein
VDAVGRPTDCIAVAPLTVLRHRGDRHSGDAAAWSVPLRAPWALPTTERMDPTCHDFKFSKKKRFHENPRQLSYRVEAILSSRMALGRSAGDMRTRRAGSRACRQQLEEPQRQQRKRLQLEDSSQHFKTKLQSSTTRESSRRWQQVSVMLRIVRLARKLPESVRLSRW